MESTGKPPHGSNDQTAVVASGVKHRYEGVQLEKNVVDRSYEQIDTTGGHVDTALAEQNIYDKVDEQVRVILSYLIMYNGKRSANH
ncbi:hypothetical protein Btru_069816 [Bulinus truncatus]|nr:hypothetical protein Btru_069816 [Bulinus truncatus]